MYRIKDFLQRFYNLHPKKMNIFFSLKIKQRFNHTLLFSSGFVYKSQDKSTSVSKRVDKRDGQRKASKPSTIEGFPTKEPREQKNKTRAAKSAQDKEIYTYLPWAVAGGRRVAEKKIRSEVERKKSESKRTRLYEKGPRCRSSLVPSSSNYIPPPHPPAPPSLRAHPHP